MTSTFTSWNVGSQPCMLHTAQDACRTQTVHAMHMHSLHQPPVAGFCRCNLANHRLDAGHTQKRQSGAWFRVQVLGCRVTRGRTLTSA